MGWSAAGGSGRKRDGREPRSFRRPNAVSGGAREAGGRRGASRLSSRLGCGPAGVNLPARRQLARPPSAAVNGRLDGANGRCG